ncbi:type 1 capsular polysaccharide biosynthesis protein J [Skermanella stibiiresistens SB22]|uniref:Type 1 capsular polysaccharide biosynthesis protein J n=1 Tax=Skermanella stibiiresistens SB22 TaxID=1385369 RepID=W9HAF1_9PROT|nr:type 1 capsular polysaccharide biosynthesis protein J [Skermanella stibiiresistens SB22]
MFGGHPASVGETYPRHLEFAFKFGVRMIVGGLACCVHGLFPFLFVTTGGRTVRELHAAILAKRFRSLTQGGDIPKPDFEI